MPVCAVSNRSLNVVGGRAQLAQLARSQYRARRRSVNTGRIGRPRSIPGASSAAITEAGQNRSRPRAGAKKCAVAFSGPAM
mgnify:CR=1 FL=1